VQGLCQEIECGRGHLYRDRTLLALRQVDSEYAQTEKYETPESMPFFSLDAYTRSIKQGQL